MKENFLYKKTKTPWHYNSCRVIASDARFCLVNKGPEVLYGIGPSQVVSLMQNTQGLVPQAHLALILSTTK